MSNKTKQRFGEKLEYLPPGIGPDARMLYGAHVNLQPLDTERHGRALWEAFQAQGGEAVWDYLPYGPFATCDEFCACYDALNAGGDPHFFAIIPKSTGLPAGVASYLNIVPVNGSIEIGHINLSPSLQGTTAATEALFLMMRHAMDDLGNRRLEWKCNALNDGSKSAAERLGFTFEGIFRQHMVVKGYNRDSVWFSIIDKEWSAIREAFFSWMHEDNFDASGKQRKSLSSLTKQVLKSKKK